MWALGEAFAAAPVIGLDNDTLTGRSLVAVRLGAGGEGMQNLAFMFGGGPTHVFPKRLK